MPLLLISGIASGAQALLGAGQMIAGYSKQRKADQAADDAIKNLVSIQTQNKLKAMQVPTMGTELQERTIARTVGTEIGAQQQAGAAGVIGGAGRTVIAANEAAAESAAEIDRMQAQRDKLVLTEEQRIERDQQNLLRDVEDMRLQGAQTAAAQGAQQVQAGATALGGAIGTGAELYAGTLNPYGNLKNTETLATTPSLTATTPSTIDPAKQWDQMTEEQKKALYMQGFNK